MNLSAQSQNEHSAFEQLGKEISILANEVIQEWKAFRANFVL